MKDKIVNDQQGFGEKPKLEEVNNLSNDDFPDLPNIQKTNVQHASKVTGDVQPT